MFIFKFANCMHFTFRVYLITIIYLSDLHPKFALVKAREAVANILQKSRQHWRNLPFAGLYLKPCLIRVLKMKTN